MKWTEAEIQDLCNSPLTASFQLASRYGRSERAVKRKRKELGLPEPYITPPQDRKLCPYCHKWITP